MGVIFISGGLRRTVPSPFSVDVVQMTVLDGEINDGGVCVNLGGVVERVVFVHWFEYWILVRSRSKPSGFGSIGRTPFGSYKGNVWDIGWCICSVFF